MSICSTLELPKDAISEADAKEFEIKGYAFGAEPEETRSARVVRVGVIQNKIILPTDAPVLEQVKV